MEFRTLEHCTLADITAVFNNAFSDYLVPLKLTEEALAEKMQTENITLELSAGAFDNNQLLGFILHGYDLLDDVQTVYNGGTGVIPSHRGKGITESIYQFIIPQLQARGIHQHLLEVISTNQPAIRVYQKLGFEIQKELGVYKKTETFDNKTSFVIKPTELNESLLTAFNSCAPSWQNSTASILRNFSSHEFLAVYEGDDILGCAVYVPATGRVKQLAVHPQYRRQQIGTALISYMMQHKQSEALAFTNIDLNYKPAAAFFQNLGFQQTIIQYEMKLVK